MAKQTVRIAKLLGAKRIGRLPDTGGGAFGAARLSQLASRLKARLRPGEGKRPGRPTDPSWQRSPKIPISRETEIKLAELAEQASKSGRQVSPMQVAAQLLEDALTNF
jgi:hypothetical protein